MQRIPKNEALDIAPFTRVPEDGEVIIGWPDAGVFLVVEPAAAEVLDWLAAGTTVAGARRLYRERYGEALDIDDFLEQLASRGLVRARSDSAGETAPPGGDRSPVRFHLEWISPRVARALFGPPTVAAIALVVLAGLVALVANPGLVPSWRALYFPTGLGFYGTLLLAAGLALVAVHEMAHFLAARAAGVSCRFGFGTRLWIPVAETDMTGIWAVPRSRRYVPILAGPLVDAAGASLAILLLFAAEAGWIALSGSTVRVLEGLLLIYLLALLWQCYLFVRTDFYYLLANLLRCKNLMQDTETFLRDRLARRVPWMEVPDRLELPRHERRAVRGFAFAWLGGRLVAVAALVFIQLPIAWSYLRRLVQASRDWISTGRLNGGPIFLTAFGLLAFVLGLTYWLYQLYQKRYSS